MNGYTTIAERAATIRAALKKLGWSSKDVSVRSESFSMGSAIRCEIKNAKVPLAVVKEIAEREERIDRCAYSGEILSGCNRYVTVTYSDEARAALAAPYLAPVEAAARKAEGNSLFAVEGTPFLIGAGRWPELPFEERAFSLWGDSHITEGALPSLATAIGERMLALAPGFTVIEV